MRPYRGLLLWWSFLTFGAVAPALAADSGQAVITKTYAVYFRDGFSPKNVAAFQPYFDPGLFALAVRWSKTPPLTGRKSFACTFDSDMFSNAQNGRPVPPITIGTAMTSGATKLFPVDITLQFTKGTLVSHVTVAVTQNRVSDIIPIVHGKSYPTSSLRAQLTRFSKNPDCR